MSSRPEARKDYTSDIRIMLLERDADECERSWEELRDELRSMKRILTGLLISITTAAVLLGLNILVAGGPQ